MTSDMIAAYGVAIASLVAAAVGVLVKPLIEALPFANPARPAAYNGAAHDALIRASNVLLNVAGVALLAMTHGQLTLANWLPVTLQIAVQAIGSHALYQAIKPSAPLSAPPVVVSNAAIAQALNAAISASEVVPAARVGQPNALKTPSDAAPAPSAAAVVS